MERLEGFEPSHLVPETSALSPELYAPDERHYSIFAEFAQLRGTKIEQFDRKGNMM